jgi:hypothetical protein
MPTSPSPKDTRDFFRSAGVNVSESTALQVWKGTVQGQDLDTDSKTTKDKFKNITISAPPGVKEKTIKVTNIGGEVVEVTPQNIVIDDKGRGVLVGVSQKKTTETEGAADVEQTKVESQTLTEHVIKMTPSLIKRINSTYGTDILQGAQAPASTSQSDPMGIL